MEAIQFRNYQFQFNFTILTEAVSSADFNMKVREIWFEAKKTHLDDVPYELNPTDEVAGYNSLNNFEIGYRFFTLIREVKFLQLKKGQTFGAYCLQGRHSLRL